jgi:nucleoside-diphosphate-sugar epimerase
MLSHINVGTGHDVAIGELAELLREVTGFQGQINLDPTRPDGAPRKLMNVDRLTAMGWQAGTSLEEGVRDTYRWYLRQSGEIRER